ncbi:hypothetical protein JXVLWARM_CDS_0017 [Burkholderia phage Bm1]
MTRGFPISDLRSCRGREDVNYKDCIKWQRFTFCRR